MIALAVPSGSVRIGHAIPVIAVRFSPRSIPLRSIAFIRSHPDVPDYCGNQAPVFALLAVSMRARFPAHRAARNRGQPSGLPTPPATLRQTPERKIAGGSPDGSPPLRTRLGGNPGPTERASPRYAVASPPSLSEVPSPEKQDQPRWLGFRLLSASYQLNEAGNVHQPRLLCRSIGAVQRARDHQLQIFGAHFVGLVF